MVERKLTWRCIKWLLVSDYISGVREACACAVQVGKRFGVSGYDLLSLELAVDEAVTNALEAELTVMLDQKGSSNRKARLSEFLSMEQQSSLPKPICLIIFWVKNDLLKVEVLDTGPGFVPSLEEEPDPMDERGRGCIIMKNCMDRAIWRQRSNGGTRCILLKKMLTRLDFRIVQPKISA